MVFNTSMVRAPMQKAPLVDDDALPALDLADIKCSKILCIAKLMQLLYNQYY